MPGMIAPSSNTRNGTARSAAALLLVLGTTSCASLLQTGSAPPVTAAASDLNMRLADATLQGGAAETTLHVLNSVLAHDPGNLAALLRRGQALMMLNRPGEAARSYAQAVAEQPASVQSLAGLARAREAVGDARAAETAWRRALACAPGDAALRTGLAISLDLQERHDAAQALYRSVLAETPDDPGLRSDLGLSLALSGHAAEGLPLLRQAADEGFGTEGGVPARARHNLALGLILVGDEAAARTLLSEDLQPAEASAALAGLREFAAAR